MLLTSSISSAHKYNRISLQKSRADVTPHCHNNSSLHTSSNTSSQSDSTLGFTSVEQPLSILKLGELSELHWKSGSQTEEQTLESELDEIQK